MRKSLPTTLVYAALQTDDESDQPRRLSKGGIRTSGLQVPGLPRPGKTTQGQDTRKSSEPKKSFRTIRNFWRQLEGGGNEPNIRRPFGRKPQKAEEKSERVSLKRVQEAKSQRKSSSGRRSSRTSNSGRKVATGRASQDNLNPQEEELHTHRRPSQNPSGIHEEHILPSLRTSQLKTSTQGDERLTTPVSSQRTQSIHGTEHLPSGRTSQFIPTVQEEELRGSLPALQHLSSKHEPELRTSRPASQRVPSIHVEEYDSIQRLPPIAEEEPPFLRQQSRHSEHGNILAPRTTASHLIPPDLFDLSDEAGEEEESEVTVDETDETVDGKHLGKSVRRDTSPREELGTGSRLSKSGGHTRDTINQLEELRSSTRDMSRSKSDPLQDVRRGGSYVSQGTPKSVRLSIEQEALSGYGDSAEVQGSRETTKVPIEHEAIETGTLGLSATHGPPPPPPPMRPTTFLKPPSFWHTKKDDALPFRRPSIVLPILLDEEKHFHEMVAAGDVMAVQDFLERRPNFNINCTNYQGVSALLIAVKSGNEDMTLFLLAQPSLEIGDAHLYAIRDNRTLILRMILDTFQSINPSLEFMACANSAEFAENVTPLILAAQSGHYEIIGILLERGHTIPQPHPPRCFCKEECQVLLRTEDPLSVASGKLHIYRALCNPAYICQTSNDPILTAFILSKELSMCGHIEQIYLRQYEDLAEATRNFAVDLIAEARSSEEVEAILSETSGMNLRGSYIFPRLIMAMDFKQKEFVSHPNVQQVLEKKWLGDWVAWKGYRKYTRAIYFLPRIVMLPGILFILMFMPTSSWARYYALPINKLLSNVASYVVFLVLVFIQSNVDKKNQTRDTKPTGVEVFLAIYVVAFLYNSIRSLIIEGPRRFFGFMWNLYELVMELLFLLTFIFWIIAAVKTTITGTKDVERKYWHYLDPELIAEGLFVLATIMAYMKILLICQMSYDLGPLQVSLGKMTNDCAIFSVILGIIMLAFTVGLCRFYSYYEGMEQKNPDTGEVDSKQENSFTSFLETFKTLFWGLFGMPSYEVADVVLDNLNDENGKPTIINEHHFTESIGYIVFAIYMTLTVIVILNMLIATMSNTFQKVTDNVDMEWAFGGSEVKLAYMNKPVMPPPFNLIPTTRGLVDLFKGAKAKAGKISGIGVDVEKGLIEEEKKVEEFSLLMSQLVQRYFSTKSEVDV